MILAACASQNIDKEHLAYIENLGWTIQSFDSTEQVTLALAPETIANYEEATITFIEEYIGKEVTITSYTLKEKDPENDQLLVYIYEHQGEIIGTIGKIQNATPGIFNPANKAGLEIQFF
ncbi:DUF4830 domain-containing protein [Lysinibacillus macroides]|uniref:Uncharacterized protein n=1 Tax=Lysinibacillus macroides TaxID=33935 RepID=A0A0N0CUQ2_9BACI|nr:DUF4830 domain-containing protein [Lysinibacillus macroides]KOY80651.1 hypothetical protein ADM90_15745 [Lysinibacillus macroides]QPR69790.1 DUF4830 domain-containing protein [Lysinibacillus macroides]